MPSKLPYNSLPNLGELQEGDIVPILRPPHREGSAFISDVKKHTRPYKTYTALLNQSGTDAPVDTILENTIGNITWTRDDVGVYVATTDGLFYENKTFVSLTFGAGNLCILNSLRLNDDIVVININDIDSPHNAIDINGMLQIEIKRFYPDPS